MIEPPRGTLETPIGTVSFAMTEASHVYLNLDGHQGQAVTIRGIPFHVSYHCHLVDGKWTAKDYHDPYLSRKDCYKEASQAARNMAREVLAKAWTEYLAAHPDLSRQAEQAKAAHEMAQLESELADRGILSTAWTDYLAGHPGLTRKAALAQATYDVDKLANELVDLLQKTAAKQAELKVAEKALAGI